MNKITNDFFTCQHPGFNKKIKIDDNNILGTNVPIVEIDIGLDVDVMLEDARKVEIIDHIRAPNPFAKEPRYQGWQLISLWNNYPARKLPHIPSMLTGKFDDAVAPVLDKDYDKIGNILRELERVNLNVRRMIVTVMKPGAYVSPHRDISFSKSPLNYVWIPLNYPKGSHFGVYPFGEVDVKLGSVYLLNQENFPHAVANNSDEYRYVLAGWLDMPYVTKEFLETAKTSIQNQYHNNLA